MYELFDSGFPFTFLKDKKPENVGLVLEKLAEELQKSEDSNGIKVGEVVQRLTSQNIEREDIIAHVEFRKHLGPEHLSELGFGWKPLL